ncbi:MAG: hypothetical protein AABN95_16060 [Acidobacteriota bacterium]
MADEPNTDAALKTGDDPEKKTDASTDKSTQLEKTPETKLLAPEEVSRIVAREISKAEKKFKDAADKAQVDATKTETERLTGEISELKAQIRERDTRDAVLKAVQDKKFAARNPQAVYRLIKDELDITDTGKIKNLDEVLTQAKADYPELFGQKPSGSANGGEGANQTPAFDMNTQLRRMAGR